MWRDTRQRQFDDLWEWDSVGNLIAPLSLSLPGFLVAPLLILLFGVSLGWLPVMGIGQRVWDVQDLIMPAFALGWFSSGFLLRLTRSSMREILGSEYVKLARFQGTPERVVIVKHAFRDAMLPVLTLAGFQLVNSINVAVVIGVIFSWPGVGRLMIEGPLSRDFPVGQRVALMAPRSAPLGRGGGMGFGRWCATSMSGGAAAAWPLSHRRAAWIVRWVTCHQNPLDDHET